MSGPKRDASEDLLPLVGRELSAGRMVRFACGGARYLMMQENNKGYNYLSIWRVSGTPICVGRAFFDLADGVSAETVRELLQSPCLGGRSFLDALAEITIIDG